MVNSSNMAGFQSCLRNVVANNSLRLLNRNGVYLQSSRGRHILVIQFALPKNSQFINRSKLLSSSNLKYTSRLASTNIPHANLKDAVSVTSESNVAGVEAANGVAKPVRSDVTGETTVNAVANGPPNSPVSNVVIDEASLPPVPVVEDHVPAALEFLSTGLKEPSFQSIGLGSYWPPGLIQYFLEYLHISLDLPWWGAISLVTVIFRIVAFPLNIKSRRNAVTMNNNLPQLQLLNLKLTEARQSGNYYDAARYAQEMQIFLKEKKINPIGSLLPALAQGPIFLSMYWALRGMANAPVESMKTGGLFWFQDLTVADPYYLLPALTALSFLAIIEIGADGVSIQAVKYQWIKYVMRGIPFVILPFTLHLPEAVLWYWTVSNAFALCQVLFLKLRVVRNYLDLPKPIAHDPQTLPMKKKGALEGFREGLTNARIAKELDDREKVNTAAFEMAGKGPVPRTFKKNPKLVQQRSAAKLSGK